MAPLLSSGARSGHTITNQNISPTVLSVHVFQSTWMHLKKGNCRLCTVLYIQTTTFPAGLSLK